MKTSVYTPFFRATLAGIIGDRAMVNWLVVIAISTLAVTTNAQAEELNLGSRKATSQEIIDHLKTPNDRADRTDRAGRKIRTRGIRLKGQPAATQAPSTATPQPVAPPTDNAPTAISMQVLFEFNSDVLTREAIEYLHPLGQALQSPDLSGMRFVVEGHTDAVGSDAYNLSLSQRRALAVKQHLAEYYGVQSAALVIVGRGEHALLEPDNPTSAANRRVRIVNITDQ